MASPYASSSRPVSPPSGGYSRRSSIASSSASTSRAADPFANAASSWYHPTSPTSSTISGGSPRSFYSAAQASASEAGHRSVFRDGGHLSLHQVASNASTTYEDDIGDVTITQDHNISPQRSLSRDRKGKARQDSEEYSYSENVRFYAEHAGFDANEDDEEVTSESPEESQRIEAVSASCLKPDQKPANLASFL